MALQDMSLGVREGSTWISLDGYLMEGWLALSKTPRLCLLAGGERGKSEKPDLSATQNEGWEWR